MSAAFIICVSKVQCVVSSGSRTGFFSVLLKALWQRELWLSRLRATSCDSPCCYLFYFIFLYHCKWYEEDKYIWKLWSMIFREFVWHDTNCELEVVICWDEGMMVWWIWEHFEYAIFHSTMGFEGGRIVVVFHVGECSMFARNFWFLYRDVK